MSSPTAEFPRVLPRRAARVLGALLLGAGASNCGLDKLTGGDSASAVTFAVSGDSVLAVGVSRPYTVTPSAPVNFGNITLAYTVSDTGLARLDSVQGQTAWVTGRRNGTLRVRLVARSPELPGGRTDSVAVRIRFGAIRIDPIDTIAGLGPLNNANQRTVVVRGTRPDGSPSAGTPTVAATVVSRDTARLRALVAGGATFVARDTGRVWLVATFDGVSDSVLVPIRRRPTRVVTQPLTFGALFTARAPVVRVLDAGDSAIVGAAYRVAGIDTVRLQVDSSVATAPRLIARVRDTASFQVTAGALSSTRTGTAVVQVPASVVLTAGAGQSVRYGLPLPVAPRVIVRDSGGQGVSGVAVTFAVPNAGNGSLTGAATTTNAAGEATLGGWTLGPNAGTDSLTVSVGSLAPLVVTATALPGAAARVRFVVAPQGGGIGVPLRPVPEVAIEDSIGNRISDASDSVSVATTVAGAGGTLGGRPRVAAQGGVARFDSLVFSDTAAAVRLVATRAGLLPDTSPAFPIGTAPTQLVFTTQPVNTTGGRRLAPITLEFRDASGQRAAGAADSVTIRLAGTLGTLSGTTRRAAVAGRVTFDDLSVDLASSGYVLIATGGGFNASSGAFSVLIGPPARLVFRTPIANVAPGVPQSIIVAVTDSGGNQVQSNGTVVVLRLATNPGGATLTDSVQAINFQTAFFNSSVSAAGTGYRFSANASGLAQALSTPFNVAAPGAAARVRFVSKAPEVREAGGSIASVELVDANGVRLTATRFPYAVSILTGPAGAALSTPGDSIFNNGVGFPRVRFRQAGAYRLLVSAPGLAPDTSGPITVVPGNGTRLITVLQPTAVGVGAPVTAQVALADSIGNPTTRINFSDVGNTLVIDATAQDGTGAAVTLGGTTQRTTVGGVATFDDLTLPAAGSGNRIVFSTPGIPGTTTDTFSVRVAGAATRLRVSALPTAINGGSRISPAFRVSVLDANGTQVASRTDAITLTLRGPSGATFTGPATVNAVNGVASFPALTIPRADTGLRLVASSAEAGISPDSTPAFAVNIGPASRLALRSVPTSITSGVPMTPPVVVAVTDSGGNTITAASDSLELAYVRPSIAGIFFTEGRRGVRAVNGVAAFDSVFITASGFDVRLLAVSQTRGGLVSDTGALTAVRQGPPVRPDVFLAAGTRLYIENGLSLGGQISASNNSRVDTATTSVTATVLTGPPGGAVLGPTTVSASSGTWSMNNLLFSRPGEYRLLIAGAGLPQTDTTPVIRVVGRPARARLLTVPAVGVRNGVLGAVRVVPVDSLGQSLPAFALSATVSLSAVGGVALTGTTARPLTTLPGDTVMSATFADLIPAGAGALRLVAQMTTPSAAPDTSATVTVAPFSEAQSLQFTVQPSSIVAGGLMSVAPQVQVRDSVGNLVTDATPRSIALALASNPGNGFLSGTLSVTLAAGTGTGSFPNLSINNVGAGYTLLATSTGLNAAVSQPFNVVGSGDAIALRFVGTTVPATATAGASLAGTGGTLAVEIINSAGTRVTGSTAPVTLALQGGRVPISGVATVNAVGGVATFSSANITRADTGYVFVATSPALNPATAATRTTISAASATRLAVLDSMPTTVAGTTWPAQRVAITDNFGNVVRTATNTVNIRAGQTFPGDSSYVTYWGSSGLGGPGTAAPTLSVAAVNGIATFTGLRPRRETFGDAFFNQLYFESAGLTSAITPRFRVVSAPAVRLVSFAYNKSDYVNNEPIQGYVAAIDSIFNTDRNVSGTITLTPRRADGTALPAGIALSPTAALSMVQGFVQYDRRITGLTSAQSLQLRASLAGSPLPFDTVASGTLAVAPFGPARWLAFSQQPTQTARNTNMTPPVVVSVTDTLGNVVSNLSTGVNGLTGTITLELPNGSTVGGATTVLLGAGPVNLINGRATFPGVQVNNAGIGYQLRARTSIGTTVPGVTAASFSSLFTITP